MVHRIVEERIVCGHDCAARIAEDDFDAFAHETFPDDLSASALHGKNLHRIVLFSVRAAPARAKHRKKEKPHANDRRGSFEVGRLRLGLPAMAGCRMWLANKEGLPVWEALCGFQGLLWLSSALAGPPNDQ